MARRGWHEALNCKRVGSMSLKFQLKKMMGGKG